MKLRYCLPVLAIAPAAQGCQTAPRDERPNVIFILSDDHAAQTIGAYGSIYRDLCPTPNIDRLAAEGAIFRNAFCTNAISGPSRATILTGQYSHKNGFYKNEGGLPLDTTAMTFPRILHDNGYTTAIVGKWHLWSTPQGFDYYKYHTLIGEQGVYWDPVWNENGKKVPEKGYATTLTARAAINWLENIRDKSKPFCLLYHFKAPHRPWEPDSCYMHLFDNVDMPYPETFDDDYATRELTAGNTAMTIASHLNRQDLKIAPPEGLSEKEIRRWNRYGDKGESEYLSPSDTLRGEALKRWKYQRYVKDYLATTKSVDDQVGNLLQYLKEKGLDRNTIIVYCGDQGFYLGEHGWFDKRFIYEESFRMPFIVRYPEKIKPGTDISNFIANIDFAPTLLDFCGVEAPEAMQGKSYRKMLTGEDTTALRDAVYYHYYEYPLWHHVQPHYGVRTDRYVMAHFYYDIDVWELFDLEKDPNELNNVYNDPAYADVREALHKRLGELQQEFGDDASLEEYRYITATNFREVSEDYYKKGDNSLNAPRKEASKKR